VLRAGSTLRAAAAENVADDQVLVLVTHDGVGRAVLMQALDQPSSAYRRLILSPCDITEIDFTGARTQVLGVNSTEHLTRA
jgi:broad specificity phosphatase PhoE